MVPSVVSAVKSGASWPRCSPIECASVLCRCLRIAPRVPAVSSSGRPRSLCDTARRHVVPTNWASGGELCHGRVAMATASIEPVTQPVTAPQDASRTIRIGIDTGGTFTDVVAFDEATGELVTTKTPSTPGNPADGFMTGIEKVLGIMGVGDHEQRGHRIAAVSHGTTVATNQLLEGKVGVLGFVTTEGYEAVLEIARQSVPDGYGNSYFWVKPDRIVPRHLVKGVGGRLDHEGRELRPFDESRAREVARWFRDRGIDTLGVCFLHSYANPEHEERMRTVLAEEHPAAVVSISSQVLREYREYERSMTTLVDAAVKPTFSRYVNNIKSRLVAFVVSTGSTGEGAGVPFYVMKSNG